MYFLTDYPVVLENISRYRCTMAYIEANSIRTSNSHVYWSMRSCETNLRWLLSNTPSEISPKLLWEKLKTNLEQNRQRPALVVMRRPGCMRKANRSPACLRILTEPKTKGGERMFEMSAHALRLYISYQSSLAYPCVHETRWDTSKNVFESVERLDSLSRFFWGRIKTRPGRIWTAITMHLWSIDSQSQREVLFTWWALEWRTGKELLCWCGNLNSYVWNGFGLFSKCK